jgi:hypothetical protein
MNDNISTELKALLFDFKKKFNYEITKINRECKFWVFERIVEDSRTHQLILEDHREDVDIGDWLIFSYLIDDERNWYGNYIETQYPLTYSEYKFIEKIINELETESEIKK